MVNDEVKGAELNS